MLYVSKCDHLLSTQDKNNKVQEEKKSRERKIKIVNEGRYRMVGRPVLYWAVVLVVYLLKGVRVGGYYLPVWTA